MKLECGCTPDISGFGWCHKCTMALNKKCYERLTPEQKAYDAYVTNPRRSTEYEDEGGCTCHIDPPCNYCTNKSDCDDTGE